VRDGERFAGEQERIVIDIPNVRMPEVSVGRSETPPLLDRLSRPVAERVRTLVGHDARWQPLLDRLSGLEFAVFILADGQTPSNPSVGGTIVEQATARGKPVSTLLSQAELQGLLQKPDLVAVDKRIDEKTVAWLLDLRDRVGPVGKHFETLYAERRSGDIRRLTAEMHEHGMPGLGEMAGLPGDKVVAMIVTRTAETLKKPPRAFMLLPIGALCDKDGVLDTLRRQGVRVTPLA
jgi:hypothetical protein